MCCFVTFPETWFIASFRKLSIRIYFRFNGFCAFHKIVSYSTSSLQISVYQLLINFLSYTFNANLFQVQQILPLRNRNLSSAVMGVHIVWFAESIALKRYIMISEDDC